MAQSFREKHPHVTVNVDVRTSFVDLRKDQADVAIRFGLKPPDGDIVARRVLRADVALYASRAYLNRHGRITKLEEMSRHAIVRGSEVMSHHPMERAMDRYADPSKSAYRSSSMYARLGAIRAGLGVGFAGCFMAESEKSLERLPFRFPDAGAHLWMLVHVDMRKNARVRAFFEHAHAALLALRGTFELES